MNKHIRINKNLRQEFNKAYMDLKYLLPCYAKKYHYKIVTGYLKTYNLLNESKSAKGRLLYKLKIAI